MHWRTTWLGWATRTARCRKAPWARSAAQLHMGAPLLDSPSRAAQRGAAHASLASHEPAVARVGEGAGCVALAFDGAVVNIASLVAMVACAVLSSATCWSSFCGLLADTGAGAELRAAAGFPLAGTVRSASSASGLFCDAEPEQQTAVAEAAIAVQCGDARLGYNVC